MSVFPCLLHIARDQFVMREVQGQVWRFRHEVEGTTCHAGPLEEVAMVHDGLSLVESVEWSNYGLLVSKLRVCKLLGVLS